jgi:hypothetical protein
VNVLHQEPFRGLGFSGIRKSSDTEILLVELVEEGEVPSKAGEFPVFVQQSQAD